MPFLSPEPLKDPRFPLEALSPFGWAAVVGTVFVVVAALAAMLHVQWSEHLIFYVWLVGILLQIVGGTQALYVNYEQRKRIDRKI
jgi:hypothetical protein